MGAEEFARVVEGVRALSGIFQVRVGQIGKGLARQRRLARLTRAGQRDHGIAAGLLLRVAAMVRAIMGAPPWLGWGLWWHCIGLWGPCKYKIGFWIIQSKRAIFYIVAI